MQNETGARHGAGIKCHEGPTQRACCLQLAVRWLSASIRTPKKDEASFHEKSAGVIDANLPAAACCHRH